MLKKLLIVLILLPALPAWIAVQDYLVSRRGIEAVRPADKAVVLATKAYEQGRPNPCLAARVEAGAALYRAGKVKKLVMSGGINRDHRYGSRTMQALAERMGVPASAIEQEDQSSDTFENIVFSARFIENSPRVVLVSAGYHLMRSRWMAEKQWPGKDIQVFAAPFCSEPNGGYAFSLVREVAAVVKNGAKGRF
ncbi:YdcF family protein [Neisseria chenwenguii]|nr:YdcF family protein [Neisseria chenwenguii]